MLEMSVFMADDWKDPLHNQGDTFVVQTRETEQVS